jgi:hypothetical protein
MAWRNVGDDTAGGPVLWGVEAADHASHSKGLVRQCMMQVTVAHASVPYRVEDP